MTSLQFDGLVIDDSADRRFGYHLARLSGWRDGAPSRADPEDKPQANGAFRLGRVYRSAKVVSVEGSFNGRTMAEAYTACDELAALCADGLPRDFTVYEPYSERTMSVSLANGPTVPDELFSPYFQFAFDVVSPDPLKYSAELQISTGLPVSNRGFWPTQWPLVWGTGGSSGRARVQNVGTADSRNIMRISGGGASSGFQLTAVGTGQTLRLERPVTDGQTVEFNTKTGRAYLDGSDVTRFLTDDDWFVVPAKSSIQVQFSALGSVTGEPRLTILHQAAYW